MFMCMRDFAASLTEGPCKKKHSDCIRWSYMVLLHITWYHNQLLTQYSMEYHDTQYKIKCDRYGNVIYYSTKLIPYSCNMLFI